MIFETYPTARCSLFALNNRRWGSAFFNPKKRSTRNHDGSVRGPAEVSVAGVRTFDAVNGALEPTQIVTVLRELGRDSNAKKMLNFEVLCVARKPSKLFELCPVLMCGKNVNCFERILEE